MVNKYRSGSERRLADVLKAAKCPFQFEPYYIQYRVEQTRKYLPDFVLPNGIILEVKGRFTSADRQKQLLVRKSNPFEDIRIVFDNPNNKLYKGAKSTYATWCIKHGIRFCSAKDHAVIREWLNEKYRFFSADQFQFLNEQHGLTQRPVRRNRASSPEQDTAKPARKNTIPKRTPTSSPGRNKARDTKGTRGRKGSTGPS